MADQKYNVEVDFTVGKQSKEKVKQEIKDVQSQAAKVVTNPQQVDTQILGGWKSEFDQIQAEMAELGQSQNKVWEAGKKASKAYQKVIGDSAKSVEELRNSIINTAGAEELQAKALKHIRSRATELRAESAILRRSASDLAMFSRAALVGGTALIAGIFKWANDYVKEAKVATEETVRWKAAQDDIHKSSQRIGQVLAREALPFLKQAAGFMKDAASFIDAHPSIIPAAIKAGEILIGIGVIGKAVATGIKLTADVLTIQSAFLRLQAARMDQGSAEKILLAAGLMNEAADKQSVAKGASSLFGAGGGFKAYSAGSLALGDVLVWLGSFTAGLIVADKAFDLIQKHDVTFQDYITEFKQALTVDAKGIGDFFGKNANYSLFGPAKSGNKDLGDDWFKKVREALFHVKENADDAAKALDKVDLLSVANSPAKDQIVNAYEDFLHDEKEMVTKYNGDKIKINQDAISDELSANRKYASEVSKITNNLTNESSKAASDFARSNADAERKYNEDHNKIIEDSAHDIERIQEKLQDDLNKLAKDNANKQADLLAVRDAVGLIKQQRKYRDDQAEVIASANKETRQRREDLKQRLEDLRQSYEQEKVDRAQQYAERVAELKAQAADRLRELQQQHEEELSRIRVQRAEKIRELDTQFKAERERRYQFFIQQIRDLDASLLGETRIRQAHQTQMLKDLDIWLESYRNHLATGLASLSTATPVKDAGGYVNKGLYRMAWDNNKEFVMSGATTRAAERLLGGNLNQEMLVQALRGGSSGNSGVYVDQRRIETSMSKEQMALYQQGAVDAITQVLGT